MSKRIPQARVALEQHLREQLAFMRRSAELYDAGHVEEARRLALALRVLLHDSNSSHALLTQLGLKGRLRFAQTGRRWNPRNLASWAGLTEIHYRSGTASFVPLLDQGAGQRRAALFGEWWKTVVVVDQRRETFSRAQLVRFVANQDGGAHVDPSLDARYANLTRANSMGWTLIPGGEPVEGVELASVRQITHEVVRTFERWAPEYLNQR